jgi:hypothetical protein
MWGRGNRFSWTGRRGRETSQSASGYGALNDDAVAHEEVEALRRAQFDARC